MNLIGVLVRSNLFVRDVNDCLEGVETSGEHVCLQGEHHDLGSRIVTHNSVRVLAHQGSSLLSSLVLICSKGSISILLDVT